MRELVVAPQPFFSPRGTPFSVYYRTRVTAQLGVDIDLLTYGQGEDVEIPGVRIIRIPAFRWLGSVKVGPSLLKLFLDQFLMLWTIGLLLRHRYDVVHAHEEAVFWCRFLKPIFRFKLVYDMHSSLPQQLANFNFSKSKLLVRMFEWLERTSLRNADAVITICPDLQNYAVQAGVPPERHFLIENSIFDDIRLTDDTQPAATDAAASPVSGDATPVVVYTGTFEPYQGLDTLIHAFKQVAGRHPDARLLMVGGDPQQVENMQRLARDVGLNGQCVFTGQVSKSQAMRYTSAATVLVSPRKTGTNTPLKVYEQLASGKPLVATRIRAHTQVLDEDVCILVDPGPDSIAQGILTALEDPKRRDRMVARARALYQQAYSRSAYEQKMRQLLEVLT